MTFLRWWLIALAVGVATFWLFSAGVIQRIFLVDVSHMTSLTALTFLVASAALGIASLRIGKINKGLRQFEREQIRAQCERILEFGWFSQDICMALGLLGTVIGCIYLFNANIGAIDPGNAGTTLKILGDISSALGIALSTTAVGVATMILLKIQAFNLQHSLDKLKD